MNFPTGVLLGMATCPDSAISIGWGVIAGVVVGTSALCGGFMWWVVRRFG